MASAMTRADVRMVVSGRRCGFGAVRSWGLDPMTLPHLETALTHCLNLLRGSHTRVTLFVVEPPRPVPVEVEAVIGDALAAMGRVGRLPGGRIGLVYLGPHGSDDRGRRALQAYVADRIGRRLLDRGWGFLLPSVGLAAVDRWSDDVRRPRDLIDALPPPRPFVAEGGPTRAGKIPAPECLAR